MAHSTALAAHYVWLEDKAVVAVKPRTELEPFFRLNYEDFKRKNLLEDQTPTRVELDAKHRQQAVAAFEKTLTVALAG